MRRILQVFAKTHCSKLSVVSIEFGSWVAISSKKKCLALKQRVTQELCLLLRAAKGRGKGAHLFSGLCGKART